MATLASKVVNRSPGVDTTTLTAASAGGDRFAPDSNTFLLVRNGGGSPITVTVVTPGVNAIGLNYDDAVFTVAAGAEKMAGPFPAQFFADPTAGGLASITYSGVTSLTIAPVQVSQP